MAVESQIDGWRKDIIANLRKAAEAAAQSAEDRGDVEMSPEDRMTLALAAADTTGQVMIAERLGQIAQGLFHQDEALSDAIQRSRTGEQILTRLLGQIEESGYDLNVDAEVLVTMAEDWLEPDGPVGFTTPEATEVGADAISRQDDAEGESEERVEDDGEAEQGS